MRILFITNGDSEMFWNVDIIQALIERGHDVDVRVTCDEISFVHDYIERGIPYQLLAQPIEDPQQYTMASTAALTYVNKALIDAGVFTFIYRGGSVSHNEAAPFLGPADNDLLFLGGRRSQQEWVTAGFSSEIIPIGCPRFDHLANVTTTDKKYFLYLDKSVYPISKIDRLRALNYLCEIAWRYPEYKLIIKPRYIHHERNYTPHYHGEDFYYLLSEIENKPPNLSVLDERISLEKLISECSVLISLPTSAFLPAMLLKKPILVLSGMNDEVIPPDLTVLTNMSDLINYYRDSGCVVTWDKMIEHLPDGLMASEAFVQDEVAYYDGKCTERLIVILEEIGKTIVGRSSRLPILGLNASNFKSCLAEYSQKYDLLSASEKELLDKENYINKINSLVNSRVRAFVNSNQLSTQVLLSMKKFTGHCLQSLIFVHPNNKIIYHLSFQLLEQLFTIVWTCWNAFDDTKRSNFINFLPFVYTVALEEIKPDFVQTNTNYNLFLDQLAHINRNNEWLILYQFILIKLNTENKSCALLKDIKENKNVPKTLSLSNYQLFLNGWISRNEKNMMKMITYFSAMSEPALDIMGAVIKSFSFELSSGELPKWLVNLYHYCPSHNAVFFHVGLIAYSNGCTNDELTLLQQNKLIATILDVFDLHDGTNLYGKASLLEKLGFIADAEKCFIKLSHDDTLSVIKKASVYYHLANIYQKTNRMKMAFDALHLCLTYEKNHHAAKVLLKEYECKDQVLKT